MSRDMWTIECSHDELVEQCEKRLSELRDAEAEMWNRLKDGPCYSRAPSDRIAKLKPEYQRWKVFLSAAPGKRQLDKNDYDFFFGSISMW